MDNRNNMWSLPGRRDWFGGTMRKRFAVLFMYTLPAPPPSPISQFNIFLGLIVGIPLVLDNRTKIVVSRETGFCLN